MYHFKILAREIEIKEETEELNAIQYILRLPCDEQRTINLSDERIMFVAIQITHWKNTIGRNTTFKEVVKRFDQYCKEAEKLKI